MLSALTFAVVDLAKAQSDYSGSYYDVTWSSCANSDGDYTDVLGITTAQSSASYNRVVPGEYMYFKLEGTAQQEIVNPHVQISAAYGLFSYGDDLCEFITGDEECSFDDGEDWEWEDYAEIPSYLPSGWTVGVTAELYTDGDESTVVACYYAKMKIIDDFNSNLGTSNKMWKGQFDPRAETTALSGQAQPAAKSPAAASGSEETLTIVISIGVLVSIAAFALLCVFRHQRLKDEVRHRLLARKSTAALVEPENEEDDVSVAKGPTLGAGAYGSTAPGLKKFPNFGEINVVKVSDVQDMTHVAETV